MKIIFFLFTSLLCLFSCNLSEKQINKELEKSPSVVLAKDKVNEVELITHQDSIEYLAIDGFYFGKMNSDTKNRWPKISGIEFKSSDDYGYCYVFGHRDTREDTIHSVKEKIKKLVKEISTTYGTPQKIYVRGDSLEYSMWGKSSDITYTEDYLWNNQYKKIVLGTIEDNNETFCITLRITNLKLEKEHDLKTKNRKEVKKNY